MTELSNAEQNFLTKKADLHAALEAEANKHKEMAVLNQRRQDLNAELVGLNQRLKQAGIEMAKGDMTSDDYIALKRTIADKTLEIESISEVLVHQKDALNRLLGDTRMIRDGLSRLITAVAGEIKQRALMAGVADRNQQLKLFALGVTAEHFSYHPSVGSESNYQIMEAYRLIGQELCKAVFTDESEACLFFVEPSRAQSAIEAMIGQAA
jgi:hypothetical protein